MTLLAKLLFLVCLVALLFTSVEAKAAKKPAAKPAKKQAKASAKKSKKIEEE
jgi:hypothetical protein